MKIIKQEPIEKTIDDVILVRCLVMTEEGIKIEWIKKEDLVDE